MTFKPMLADNAEFDKIRYPVLASPKLDGVRATFQNGSLVTRSLKPLPNKFVNELFRYPHALDGELIVGDAYSKTVFRDTMKVVMAQEADITGLRLHVFDLVAANEFQERFQTACDMVDYKRIIPVPHTLIHNEVELLKLEDAMLRIGYEGLMIRDPKGRYKAGRSTVTEGGLLKVKRRLQSEAKIVGFEEQMHNANEAKIDALGYTERSSHQANKIPMGVLGALVCSDIKGLWPGIEFNVGTGFTAEERASLWQRREILRGRVITYEYQPIGVKDKPRHPGFLGFRMVEDL
jgi:DNA ligase 1